MSIKSFCECLRIQAEEYIKQAEKDRAAGLVTNGTEFLDACAKIAKNGLLSKPLRKSQKHRKRKNLDKPSSI